MTEQGPQRIHQRERLVPISPTKREDTSDIYPERTTAIKLFSERFTRLAQIPSITTFAEISKQIASEITEQEFFLSREFLFRYFGKEMLEHLLPHASRNHIIVDPINGTLSDTAIFSKLPDTINSTPKIDLVTSVTKSLHNQSNHLKAIWGTPDITRYELAFGQCVNTTTKVIKDVQTEYPKQDIRYIRIGEPLDSPARRLEESPYLDTEGVSLGHSILAIPYYDSGVPMIVSIDATIASIDKTTEYDAEIVTIPRSDYHDFLRLRYRTRPTTSIVAYATS